MNDFKNNMQSTVNALGNKLMPPSMQANLNLPARFF